MPTTYMNTAIEAAIGDAGPLAASLGLGDGSPFVRQAKEQCIERLTRFRKNPNASDNPARLHAQQVARESRVTLDANVYAGISDSEVEAIIRAGFNSHQPPEVLLALWAKEGSTRSIDAPFEIPGATTEANARSLFRSTVFFVHLGIDHFVVFTAHPGADNTVDFSDAAAPRHETHFAAQVRGLVSDGLLSEDIGAALNAELTVTRVGSGNFKVMPSTKFYALALLLVDALFEKHLRAARADVPGATPALAYMHWNMRASSWTSFVASADRHRREPAFVSGGEPISIEQWALHTPPKEAEYGQARRNAIRFMHYIESYRPIFTPAMSLITPGIEDLRAPGDSRRAGTRGAEASYAALQTQIEDYRSDPTGTACATGPQPGARALVRELGQRFGGRGEIFNCRPVRGGTRLSLHGEGRAVDWMRRASDPAEAAEAQRIIDWLLAPDADGNTDALARRMGIQEIIWNRRIWTARRHAEGWRAYSGVNPHTDHLHIGMNWPGARMQTSFWTSAPAAPPAAPHPSAPASPPASGPAAAPPAATRVVGQAVTFGNAAEIEAFFTARTGKPFLRWFHDTQGGRGEWAARNVPTDAATVRRFALVWDRIPEMFDTPRIRLEQFVALQSIFINEIGGRMMSITEKMGRPGHPGMAYLFDAIPGLKVSYNKPSNKTAFECFNDPTFLAAHGALAPGSRLAHTTDRAWAGQTYPAGEETSMARAPFIAEADFCKFRGRGMIGVTWRGAYAKIVRYVQGYSGTNAKVLDYKRRWSGMGVEDVLTRSTNADWDDLFDNSDYVIPFAGIKLHNHGASNYLEISTDEATRLGRGVGSFHYMGYRISGGRSYGDLFKRRCVQILTALGAATPPAPGAAPVPAAPAPTAAPAAGPPPSSSLQWQGATADQLAFMRRVYDTHVRRSARTRTFVPNVPDAELATIEGRFRARTAAAEACRRLLTDARAALAAAKAAGQAQASTVEVVGLASAYRSVAQQFTGWQGGFPRYYRETQTQRAALPGGEHGEQAAEFLARHIGSVLGAPGYSLHNDGRAIDVSTREGGHTIGASTADRTRWRASWLFTWLMAHGPGYGFHQNTAIDEPWHWEYRAPTTAQGLAAVELGAIPAGQAEIATVDLLRSHHDVGPDMVLRWNAITDVSAGVDVVVHLHGFSSDRHLDLRQKKLPLSGLDFTPPNPPRGTSAPAHPAWTGRTRPTLLVLPRGRARPDHGAAYDFPALVRPGAFGQLIELALHELERQIGGGARLAARRIVLTGHSGGGAPLNRILSHTAETPADPHEVHVFDGLYGDASAVRGWVARRLRRDAEQLRSVPDPAAYMASDGGGLRVLYLHGSERATTRPHSLEVAATVRERIPAGMSFTELLQRHYRVENAHIGHSLIPYWYGGRLLADVTAAVPPPAHP